MNVNIKATVWKQLAKLPDAVAVEAMECIVELRDHPYPRGFDKVEGKEDTFRVWIRRKHRLLYRVKAGNCLEILDIAPKSKQTYK